MATASPVRRRLAWTQATVTGVTEETATARTIGLDVPVWAGHRAGQHLDIRLTADDGYQAVRSYSISSAPGERPTITVERVDDGEVSPFLVEVVEVGDTFEVRGPIGGYFVLQPGPAPVLLVGGGSGIAPLRSMWRAQARAGPLLVLYSARTADRVIFADELASTGLDARVTLTRETDVRYRHGRIGADDVVAAVDDLSPSRAYVCGPTRFVEAIADDLQAVGIAAGDIRTERFG